MPQASPPPQTKSFLAPGTVSAIYALDETHVLKARPRERKFECDAYEIEVRAYAQLGHHERIAHCEETSECLQLERGTCLRNMLQRTGEPPIPILLTTKLRWVQEAASGLAYIHSKNIIHADVGCHNIIIDQANHINYIDFAGSSIDSEDALVCYEWCSFRPGHGISVGTDIFAFGSMLFELETGRVPYSELEGTMEWGMLVTTVERLFCEGRFPSVEGLVLGDVILGCWGGEYLSMDGVLHDIEACRHGRH